MKQHRHLIGIASLFTFLIVGLSSNQIVRANFFAGAESCPTGYTCTLIPYVKGCPNGYICTPKPLVPLDVSAVSCSVSVDANRIPTFTFTGKPTGGSSAYSYTVWNQYGPLSAVPATKVPGVWGYVQNQVNPSSSVYLVVTSGTSTANVQCSNASYSINLTSGPIATSTINTIVFNVKPSDMTASSINLNISCPTGVTAAVGSVADACNSNVVMTKVSGGYTLTATFKNTTNANQTVGATASAINKYGETVATDKDALTIYPVNGGGIQPIVSSSVINTSATVGPAVVQNNRIAAYPVSFGFTIDASKNNVPVYIDATKGVVVNINATATPVTNSLMSTGPTSTAGDTASYYVISAGSTRSFIDNAMLYNNYGPGVYSLQVSQIKYGSSPSNLSLYSISDNLSNLKATATF